MLHIVEYVDPGMYRCLGCLRTNGKVEQYGNAKIKEFDSVSDAIDYINKKRWNILSNTYTVEDENRKVYYTTHPVGGNNSVC